MHDYNQTRIKTASTQLSLTTILSIPCTSYDNFYMCLLQADKIFQALQSRKRKWGGEKVKGRVKEAASPL